MDSSKKWVAGTVLAAVVLLAAGWFLVVAPQRTEAAQLREQAALQQQTNAQLGTQLEVLRTRAEKLPDKRAEIAEATTRIPAGPELPDLIRALTAAAASAGVELASVTPGIPAPVVAAEPPAPAPAADAAAPMPDAEVDPAPAPAAPAATPPVAGLSAIEVKMVVVGDFYAVEQFLAAIEDLPRALRVTGVSMDPGASVLQDEAGGPEDGLSVRSTITGQVYLAPAAGQAAAGAVTAVPAAPAAPELPAESVG